MDDKSRRDFLRGGWKLGGALLIGAAAYTGYEALRPLATRRGRRQDHRRQDVSSFATDTSTYVPAGRMYVVNANDYLFALSQKCPHLGCHVPYCESSGRFECPCHGSIYDLAGEYITGPAPRGMDRYKVTLDGENVVVDTGVLKPGPAHGAKIFLTPAQGPELHRQGLTCPASARNRRRSSPSGSNAA